ncbi:MAG TPA: hypothetical protein VK438_00645 [Xanthobacteraceae bacterium]|nr:hypothetical protein [Xanthobacteraceae bacterium]
MFVRQLCWSGIGRRLLMGQRTIEAADAADCERGADTVRLGFYCNDEIAPHARCCRCALHEQTMTVTTFAEVA